MTGLVIAINILFIYSIGYYIGKALGRVEGRHQAVMNMKRFVANMSVEDKIHFNNLLRDYNAAEVLKKTKVQEVRNRIREGN